MPEGKRGLCARHAAEIRIAWAKVGGRGIPAGAASIPGTATPAVAAYADRRAEQAAERTDATLPRVMALVEASTAPLTRAQLATKLGCSPDSGPLTRALKAATQRGDLQSRRGEGGGYFVPVAHQAAAQATQPSRGCRHASVTINA